MAQTIDGFDATGFREGITMAMRMGLPAEEERWPEFVTLGGQVEEAGVDENGVPWDPSVAAVARTETRVRAVCAIDMNPQPGDDRPWGRLQPGSVTVTLLDVEYARVKGFEYLNLWPAAQDTPVKYKYQRVLDQPTLDSVGVWVLECRTEDGV